MPSLTVFAPAKINLFLAITGRRADGFHDLVSVVSPLRWGDELDIETRAAGLYSLSCDTPSVPLDDTNLILRAAHLFANAAKPQHGAHFHLRKKVPMGAGLGGGSSDGTATLVGLNKLAGEPLSHEQLAKLAAQLGSDCSLFLHARACVMRGRGESIVPLTGSAVARLSGRRLLVFKPDFGINTAWAYRQLAASAPGSYLVNDAAEARLAAWMNSDQPTERLIFNNMEPPAFAKFLALPTLLEELHKRFGLTVGMSGSGSACFALISDGKNLPEIEGFIRQAWGLQTFVVQTETA
ncbi:MAG TPA: 4-(cytidine 5'-diphospho)-2-C-methyl-D-erythritol kinase [Opitutaceae bacterium]